VYPSYTTVTNEHKCKAIMRARSSDILERLNRKIADGIELNEAQEKLRQELLELEKKYPPADGENPASVNVVRFKRLLYRVISAQHIPVNLNYRFNVISVPLCKQFISHARGFHRQQIWKVI
jgi:hypothetical protein